LHLLFDQSPPKQKCKIDTTKHSPNEKPSTMQAPLKNKTYNAHNLQEIKQRKDSHAYRIFLSYHHQLPKVLSNSTFNG
jgi:hypothetical protein